MKTQVGSDFEKLMRGLLNRHQAWQVFSDFVLLCQIAISNAIPGANQIEKREKMYAQTIARYEKDEVSVFPKLFGCVVEALEENTFQDYLGDLYMRMELGSHWHGQFFTPYHLCEAMARISIHSEDIQNTLNDKGWVSVLDPACGAGATLITAAQVAQETFTTINWQNHFLFIGQDIDPVTAGMCYIQLSLIGAAGYIKVGNTLTDPITTNDPKQDDYWYTPMYFNNVWAGRRLWHQMDSLFQSSAKKQAPSPAIACSDAIVLPDMKNKTSKKKVPFDQISMF